MVTLLAGEGVGVRGLGQGRGTGQKFDLSNTCLIWTSYGLNERYWSTEKDTEIRLKKY